MDFKIKLLILVCTIYYNAISEVVITIERTYYKDVTIGRIKELNLITIEPARYIKYGCISEGIYKVVFERMQTYRNKDIRILLLDIETNLHSNIKDDLGRKRSGIFIHEGIDREWTTGCIIVSKEEGFDNDKKEIKSLYYSYEGLFLLEEYFLQSVSKEEVESDYSKEWYIHITSKK